MRVVVAGGSGLIGRALVARLVAEGHSVTLLSRDPARTVRMLGPSVKAVKWDGVSGGDWMKSIDGADAVVNLSGVSIAGKRWSDEQKKILIDSRIHSTRVLGQAIAGATTKPSVFVCASAVGFYGDVPEGELSENARPGEDFLAQLCVQWEAEARRVEFSGVRVVMIRSGLVLTRKGGALGKLLLPFRLFAGGPLGSGRQWWPWVHIEDEIGIMLHAITHQNVSGPVNASAPTPVRMKEFGNVLGHVLHRPSFIPAPAFALRMLLGEMADALLLSGQRAIPQKMLGAGYEFRFVSLEGALKDLLK